MVCIREGYVACFIGMRESLQSGLLFLGQNMTLFVFDSIILEAAQLSRQYTGLPNLSEKLTK